MLHLWQGHVLTGPKLTGPWTYRGRIETDLSGEAEPPLEYQYVNNRSGVQLEDGRFLFVTKFGRMTMADDMLGPFKILTPSIQINPTLPEKYRSVGFEDPVMWRDEIQFHMLINAF